MSQDNGSKRKICVVILTFNSDKYLPDLLASLEKTNWPPGEHELIFVDNNSQDKTRAILERETPLFLGREMKGPNLKVKSIINDKNLGFAGGNNVGMKYALERGADYVALLNDDTVVHPDWLQELVKVAESGPDVGAVQSLLLYWDKKDIINSAGNLIHFLGFQFAGKNLEKIATDNLHLTTDNMGLTTPAVTYCSGAAVMYRATGLKKTGLFDEVLESYHEDSEMGLNMRLHGYKSYLAPTSIVYHKYQFKGGRGIILGRGYKYYLMERNRLYFILKYYSFKTLLLISPAWFIMELGLLGFSGWRGFWREKLRGYFWVIKNFRHILAKREEIKNLKKNHHIHDADLTHDFVGRISYQEINNPLLTYFGNPVMSWYWKIVRQLL